MKDRLEKLSFSLTNDSEAFLIISSVNRFYLTDFHSSAGAVFVTKSVVYCLVDFRYGEAAEKSVKNAVVVIYKRFTEAIHELCKKHKINTIYIENEGISLGEANRFTVSFKTFSVKTETDKTLDTLLHNMRSIKSEIELARIGEAQKITEKAYFKILNYIKAGVKEKDIALELEFIMRKSGAAAVSFDLITITGSKTSLPHGVPDDTEVKAGDFVTIDIGAVFDGYHSDMTRTVAVKSVSEEKERIYNIVLNAQLKALAAIKADVTAGSVDKAARDYIKAAGYADYFGHSAGHGVGLDIHETPYLVAGSNTLLLSGMVITAEPGIYLPGKFGVRIEDMVCVTSNGYSNFTTVPKELTII
ncbi:peptidase M24 [Clostridia bacterium]|nr:peptidase M24 [Clostridia bacterium]